MASHFASTVELIKERLGMAGTNGKCYADLIEEINIKPPLGLYIAKNYLKHSGFTFEVTSTTIDISNVTTIPQNLRCIAPMHYLTDFYGLKGHVDVQHGENEDLPALQALATAEHHGITATEATQQLGKVIFQGFDRLYTRGAIIKRLLMPCKGANKQSRTQGSVTLYHLKRYARDFDPSLYQCQLYPGDLIRSLVYQHLRGILDSNDIEQIASIDLAKYLGVKKRTMQYLRNQTVMLVRSGGECPIAFEERLCRPLRMHQLNRLGKPRVMWCMIKNDTSSNSGRPFQRLQFLSTDDQLDLLIRTHTGLSSQDIRHYLSVARKRSQKMSGQLAGKGGYPHVKVQEGKQLVYKFLPRSGTELVPYCVSNSNSIDSTTADAATTTGMETNIADVDDKNIDNTEEVTSSASNKEFTAVAEVEPITTSTSMTSFSTSGFNTNEIAAIPSGSKESTPRRASMEQEERAKIIMEYLSSVRIVQCFIYALLCLFVCI
jgi:hypothetical protein